MYCGFLQLDRQSVSSIMRLTAKAPFATHSDVQSSESRCWASRSISWSRLVLSTAALRLSSLAIAAATGSSGSDTAAASSCLALIVRSEISMNDLRGIHRQVPNSSSYRLLHQSPLFAQRCLLSGQTTCNDLIEQPSAHIWQQFWKQAASRLYSQVEKRTRSPDRAVGVQVYNCSAWLRRCHSRDRD